MKRVIFIAVIILVLSSQGLTADRVDFFDEQGRRQGYAIVDRKAGRVDFYDRQSRRTGLGRVDPAGRIEMFDLKGKRRGETLFPFREKQRKP